jgi:Fic family protein
MYPIMNRLSQRLEDLPLSSIAALGQIDKLNGQWIGGLNLSPQTLNQLKRTVLATSTGASTRIEGVKLSDEEIEAVIRGLGSQKLLDRDSQEVKGYFEVLDTIFESWDDVEFTENNIKYLHKELLKYSTKDERQRGDYKEYDNRVIATDSSGREIGTIFHTTPPYLTPKEMEELIGWAQLALAEKNYHPILVIANFIVEFLSIHPFSDGNGRLSRILTNLFMLKTGYSYMPYASQEKLIEDNKAEYYIALRKSQSSFKTGQETVEPWITFFLQICLTQAEQAIALLSSESIEKLLSPNQMRVWDYLLTVDEATVQNITEVTGVARPTVRQALERLLSHKKIERIGQGRTTRYRKL